MVALTFYLSTVQHKMNYVCVSGNGGDHPWHELDFDDDLMSEFYFYENS
jgi:hypothetical protein